MMVFCFQNGTSVPISQIPVLSQDDIVEAFANGPEKRILAVWQLADNKVVFVLGNPASHQLEIFSTADHCAITEKIPALHRFERELRGEADKKPFIPLKGDAAHEVAVGPVHAGVIEPGHFRFQCAGEDVFELEIQLGYQHRGAENLIVSANNDNRRLALAETVAGDSSVAASLACAKALGQKIKFPHLMSLLLELERIANHVGDLGALAGDVAYLPTASFCGRIRGEYLNMTAEFCGNRFGRGSLEVEPPKEAKLEKVRAWFERTEKELFHALNMLFSELGAIDRFENTGKVPFNRAKEIGLTGMAGRASGLKVDSRIDFPLKEEVITDSLISSREMTGDVLSRAWQRYDELKVSHEIVRKLLNESSSLLAQENKDGATIIDDSITIGVVEAWRGELVHLAVRIGGKLAQYKIFDPSYHNWFGLAQALRGEQISNFPICNKSFNLSYCGVDR